MTDARWLCVEPYVHVSVKQNRVLLYNTLSGTVVQGESPSIARLVSRITAVENLLVTELSNEELNDPSIATFIQKCRQSFVADFIPKHLSEAKPIELMPRLHLQRDPWRQTSDATSEVAKADALQAEVIVDGAHALLEYVGQCTLYINDSCGQECTHCKHAFRQFLSCTRDNGHERELPLEKISQFLDETAASGLFRINVSGGDVFRYSGLKKLVQALNAVPAAKAYITHYVNVDDRITEIGLCDAADVELRILVSFPADKEKLRRVARLLNRANLDYVVDFVIQCERDVECADGFAAELELDEVTYKVCYNGSNRQFVRSALFLAETDIADARPSMQEILARGTVNTLAFGNITVLSDGTVHASINAPPLGRLGHNTARELVWKEAVCGESWRRLRSHVEPCRSCVYELLCPPLTDYEHMLCQNNLCHNLHDARSEPHS